MFIKLSGDIRREFFCTFFKGTIKIRKIFISTGQCYIWLTQSYDNCLTERIKDIYASYGDVIIDGVTFDGRIMAIPETNIEDGPNLLWLRKD